MEAERFHIVANGEPHTLCEKPVGSAVLKEPLTLNPGAICTECTCHLVLFEPQPGVFGAALFYAGQP